MKIKDFPKEGRPREIPKVRAESLSDAELFAILLRTGTKGKNVVEMKREDNERRI